MVENYQARSFMPVGGTNPGPSSGNREEKQPWRSEYIISNEGEMHCRELIVMNLIVSTMIIFSFDSGKLNCVWFIWVRITE